MSESAAGRRPRRKTWSLIVGVVFVLASVASMIALIDFHGDGDPAGPLRTLLPVLFGLASAGSFAIGGYAGTAVLAGFGCAALYVALIFGVTLFFGP